MTEHQTNLIDKLKTAKQWTVTEAKFNGDFLNCVANVKSGSKVKKQRFSFVFDSPDDCQGPRQVGRLVGAYSEHYAKAAFEIICNHARELAQQETA